jgi:hypothetical protein
MWNRIALFILRNRYYIISILAVATVVLAYFARQVQMDYSFARFIPHNHPKNVEYRTFREMFGEDGSLMFLAVENNPLFELDFYNSWYTLGEKIKEVDGVDDVVSIAHTYYLEKNTAEKKFELKKLYDGLVPSQQFLDSIAGVIYNMPFYEGILFKKNDDVTMLVVHINESKIESKKRISIVNDIENLAKKYESETGRNVYISGLPFIRTYKVIAISKELNKVLTYSVAVLIVVLILLFRSVYYVLFPFLLSGIGTIWALGLMALLDYKITILTALVPNIIVIISITNCVYLLNKYFSELKKHGNKIRGLSKVIEVIGYTVFYANLTTAIGFGVFYFTGSSILEEFGLVSFMMVVLVYCLSFTFTPIALSFLPLPREKAMLHLDNPVMIKILSFFENASVQYKALTYSITIIVIAGSVYGASLLKTQGFILDDVPHESIAYRDLKFFEKKFSGILPVEILVDTRKKGNAMQMTTLKKIEAAQDSLAMHPLFSRPVSAVNVIKFATQAYFNNNPKHYRLPKDNVLTPELSFIMQYLNNSSKEKMRFSGSFTDSTRRMARITVQIPDIGSHRLDELIAELNKMLIPLFPHEDFQLSYTGTSIVALEGFQYLTNSLAYSVGLALLVIGIIMGSIFRSFRMLLIAMMPNIIPLAFTAGIMGYLGIPLKPSTVLVFSIAFGLSVDYTIHFLAKYKQELKRHKWDIAKTISNTIHEMGLSMLYTSVILFFGFCTFLVSEFDGTKYLGLLVSITLAAALFSNMMLLPALLLSFDKIEDMRNKLRLRRKKYL